MKNTSVICYATKNLVPTDCAKIGYSIRPSVLAMIREQFPEFKDENYISDQELQRFKVAHMHSLMEDDKGKISKIERQVAETVAKHEFMSKEFSVDDEEEVTTFGERLADKIAEFGGSWRFIITFLGIMAIWIGFNVFIISKGVFDPYPFILLNLVLSCIASLQAPVIMMSQNRSEIKDRKRSKNDFMVNLKSELEIRHLHEKMDHLITNQIQHLHEIQQMQLELLNDISESLKVKKKPS